MSQNYCRRCGDTDVFRLINGGRFWCHQCKGETDIVNKPLGYRVAEQVPVVKPEWAWNPRIPARGLTMIFGEAGIGKTTMVTDLIARWTTGRNMPETVGGPFVPINVAVYGFEDDLSSVVVPRLMAAGADLSRVFLLEVDKTRPILPDQIPEMKDVCQELECGVLVLDNIENGMGVVTDTNNSKSIRAAINPLAEMPFPVIAIHHPKKGSVFVDPTEAMGGSQAYTNVARSTMMVIPTDETGQEVAFCAVKSNFVNINQVRTLYFTFEEKVIEPLGKLVSIHWLGGDSKGARYWSKVARERLTRKETTQALRPDAPASAGGSLREDRISQKEKTVKKKIEESNDSENFQEGILKGNTEPGKVHPLRRQVAENTGLKYTSGILRNSKEDAIFAQAEVVEVALPLIEMEDVATKASISRINDWVAAEQAKHKDEEVPF